MVGDLSTLDGIVALTNLNFDSSLGGAFENVPVVNYNAAAGASLSNLVYLNTVTPILVVGKKAGDPSLLTFKIRNSNPGLVTATVSGNKLTLAYTAGQTGVRHDHGQGV